MHIQAVKTEDPRRNESRSLYVADPILYMKWSMRLTKRPTKRSASSTLIKPLEMKSWFVAFDAFRSSGESSDRRVLRRVI